MRIDTEAGPADAELDVPRRKPTFLLVLTHGAGGDPDTADLLAVRDLARELGGAVARVRQPYRVAGRRAPGAAPKQDAAWLEVIAALRTRYPRLPLIQGGRSNGARVACRTAVAADAAGVIALAFPLHPPGKPANTRVAELRAAPDVVVVNGARDPFGIPDAADATAVHVIPNQAHAFRAGLDQIAAAVRPHLERWRTP